MIPLSVVDIGDEERRLVLEVLDSGQLAQGPVVERFEDAFADLIGACHAIAVSSGTTALVAAIEAAGIGPGDEVVTSPFTFVATLNAILESGATATFADIRLDDFTMDVEAVEAAITPRTKAIIPVHLYGQPADMVRLQSIAERHGLVIIEDAAQAHGAAVGGRPVGTYGLGCFSFYATKNVAAGEGGMITTDDGALADRIRLLRGQGMRRRYHYEVPGHNYRMTDLQAAVALPQLARLHERTDARRANALELGHALAGVPGLIVPIVQPRRSHVWHQYTVRVTGDARVARDDVVGRLAEAGVASGVYYPRVVWDYDCYREHPRVAVSPAPGAAQAAAEVLSIPVHPRLTAGEVDHVAASVLEAVGGRGGRRAAERFGEREPEAAPALPARS